MDPSPIEIDLDVIPLMDDLDKPECLWLEVTDSIVPVYHESQRRKLTRAIAENLVLELW